MGQLNISQDSTVFINGQIYQSPADPTDNPTFASCMIVQNGTIQHVGSEQDAAVVAARGT